MPMILKTMQSSALEVLMLAQELVSLLLLAEAHDNHTLHLLNSSEHR